ncbi:MAG: class I mannose-6-phosphate isomerase [Dysgonamonadaceae bacterium]|jgi:mannose-6-phosphate isomerase|nr:class I mannose-6-phosphate isomerase [Dysgonamonadaceae bacterium]
MYPFKFKPILKKVLWGGDRICRLKNITPVQNGIGESWEVSAVTNNISVVDNGSMAGKSIDELIDLYADKLSGKKVFERFGKRFPLLVKFIDAQKALSIQVHPDDNLAQKRHNAFGKTEMWYVIKAEAGAYLYSGFSTAVNPETYLESIADGSFTDYLQKFEVKAGDVFFLPAGRVHAIGAGCLIAEIQQTSDITYRIFDYNRCDDNGNFRELHTGLAKDAIDYRLYSNYKTNYSPKINEIQTLVSCRHFTTQIIEAEAGKILKPDAVDDSFSIYICTKGRAILKYSNNSETIEIRQGETMLVPATVHIETILFEERGNLLRSFL